MACKTRYFENILDKKQADDLFYQLYTTIQWEEGIKSKKGFTRKAKPLPPTHYLVTNILAPLIGNNTSRKYLILGAYLNLYEDGKMWTPNPSHHKQHQFVLSLGASRTFILNKKEFVMKHGSAIIFGSGNHSVPKDLKVTTPRISIATFMVPFS